MSEETINAIDAFVRSVELFAKVVSEEAIASKMDTNARRAEQVVAAADALIENGKELRDALQEETK
jgi:hypothetical protein